MRTMYDSVTIRDLPRQATMIAVYEEGMYQNAKLARILFPKANIVVIDIFSAQAGRPHGDVLDIELGDATPAQFHEWARQAANAGRRRPTAYCSLDIADEVCALAPPGVITDVWVADWTGRPHRPVVARGNVVACQYASPGHGSGGHYDISAVYDDTWHPAGLPTVGR